MLATKKEILEKTSLTTVEDMEPTEMRRLSKSFPAAIVNSLNATPPRPNDPKTCCTMITTSFQEDFFIGELKTKESGVTLLMRPKSDIFSKILESDEAKRNGSNKSTESIKATDMAVWIQDTFFWPERLTPFSDKFNREYEALYCMCMESRKLGGGYDLLQLAGVDLNMRLVKNSRSKCKYQVINSEFILNFKVSKSKYFTVSIMGNHMKGKLFLGTDCVKKNKNKNTFRWILNKLFFSLVHQCTMRIPNTPNSGDEVEMIPAGMLPLHWWQQIIPHQFNPDGTLSGFGSMSGSNVSVNSNSDYSSQSPMSTPSSSSSARRISTLSANEAARELAESKNEVTRLRIQLVKSFNEKTDLKNQVANLKNQNRALKRANPPSTPTLPPLITLDDSEEERSPSDGQASKSVEENDRIETNVVTEATSTPMETYSPPQEPPPLLSSPSVSNTSGPPFVPSSPTWPPPPLSPVRSGQSGPPFTPSTPEWSPPPISPTYSPSSPTPPTPSPQSSPRGEKEKNSSILSSLNSSSSNFNDESESTSSAPTLVIPPSKKQRKRSPIRAPPPSPEPLRLSLSPGRASPFVMNNNGKSRIDLSQKKPVAIVGHFRKKRVNFGNKVIFGKCDYTIEEVLQPEQPQPQRPNTRSMVRDSHITPPQVAGPSSQATRPTRCEIRGNKRIIEPQSSTSSPEFYATENAYTFRRLRKLSSKRKLDMDAAESTKKKQKEDTDATANPVPSLVSRCEEKEKVSQDQEPNLDRSFSELDNIFTLEDVPSPNLPPTPSPQSPEIESTNDVLIEDLSNLILEFGGEDDQHQDNTAAANQNIPIEDLGEDLLDYEAPDDEVDQVLDHEMKNSNDYRLLKLICMNNFVSFTGHELVEAFACVARQCFVPVVSDHGVLMYTFRMFSRTQIASDRCDWLPKIQSSLPNTGSLQCENNLFLVSYQLIFYLFTLRIF